MRESFDPQERLERYEKEAHELQTQIRFLEDEVALLRRRLTNAPRQVKLLEERLVQSRADLSKALSQNEKFLHVHSFIGSVLTFAAHWNSTGRFARYRLLLLSANRISLKLTLDAR